MFDIEKGLFKFGDAGDFRYQINELSQMLNPQHKNWFHFTGRMMGKALFDGMALSAPLVRSLYKHLLRSLYLILPSYLPTFDLTVRVLFVTLLTPVLHWSYRSPVELEDLKVQDPQQYASLQYMRDNEVMGTILFENFSIIQDRLGEQVEVELCAGGKDKEVTEENKEEYIKLKVQYLTHGCKKEQIERFLAGFWEVVPPELLQVFTVEELEQVMCGIPKIEIKDWKDHTFYQGELTPSHEAIAHTFIHIIT